MYNVCLNTRWIITLIDKDFLKKVAPDAVIKRMASPVFVRGIGSRKFSSVDYATIDLYFPGNKHCTLAIHREVQVVNSL